MPQALTIQALIPFVVAFGLILVRCTGTFLFVPLLGGEVLPLRVRGAVAAIIALVLTPVVGPVSIGSLGGILLAAVGELLIGIAMGLVVRLVLITAELAGEVAGMQMGFAFNRVVDPLTREPVAITSRLLGAMITLLFLAVDGHHVVLAGLGTSLREAPVGTVLPMATAYAGALFPLLSVAMAAGLRIAAPIVVALLLTNAAIALLSRAAPQLNLFIFAFGLAISIGMLILTRSITPLLDLMLQQLRQLPDYLATVVGA